MTVIVELPLTGDMQVALQMVAMFAGVVAAAVFVGHRQDALGER